MEGADPRTDGELLVATAYDPEAFAALYRRRVRGVLAFFRRRAGRAEVALDLTAETFAAALEASARYDEIAADLSCSPSLVRKRVSRGLRRLRSDLETPRSA